MADSTLAMQTASRAAAVSTKTIFICRLVTLIQFFFVTLPSKMAKILRFGKKRNEFLCFALNFSYLCGCKGTNIICNQWSLMS